MPDTKYILCHVAANLPILKKSKSEYKERVQNPLRHRPTIEFADPPPPGTHPRYFFLNGRPAGRLNSTAIMDGLQKRDNSRLEASVSDPNPFKETNPGYVLG